MEQAGEQTPKSSNWLRWTIGFTLLVLGYAGTIVWVYHPHIKGKGWIIPVGAVVGICATVGGGYFTGAWGPCANGEEQARQRVRQAEDDLADALRAGAQTNITIRGDATLIYPDTVVSKDSEQVSVDDQISLKRDDGLTLAALWGLTHSKLDLYHTIVTGQARRSFGVAQVAMAIGFVLLVVFAVLAAEAKTTAAAISAGGLGAVSAALSGYISKTLIRSQETAASHLKEYFTQPLELSRYLAAERLLADAKELTAEQRAAILISLVQSIATAGQQDDKARDRQSRDRQSRGRGTRFGTAG